MQMNDEDARNHEVHPAAEQSKEAGRFGAIGRFANQLLVERDESIGAQDDAAGMSSGDNETLAQSVVTGRLAQGQLVGMEFLNSWLNDLEIVAAVSK